MIVNVQNVSMEFNLNRGKVRSLKERLFAKVDDSVKKSVMFKALNNVSFSLEKGETLGIIGGNGAGKSTMLKIVARIMAPTSGTVTVNGTIAPMIELGTGFDFELSATENAYLSGSVLGYSHQFIDSKMKEIFDFSELWEFQNIPLKYFSSGMVARLAFAISTLIMPDVLIVDEILSVGDMAFQQKSYQKMHDMMTGGTTVIYVSHDIGSIERLCSKVIWLDHGSIKMEGTAHEVCEQYVRSVNNG